MSDRNPTPDPEKIPPLHPWSTPQTEEPEPGWAREIRERRKARGDRLKEIFDGFAVEDPAEPSRKEPPA